MTNDNTPATIGDRTGPVAEMVVKNIRDAVRVQHEPTLRHAHITQEFAASFMQYNGGAPTLVDHMAVMGAALDRAESGDPGLASRTLAAQAVSLDAIFTELARRASVCTLNHPEAADRFMRLALKAQSNSRATLEALVKMHQPREQTVRHVHVNEGGQAVIADQFHHHAGGQENGFIAEQPHTTGTGAVGDGSALLGLDAQGDALPVPGDQGGEAMSHARR